MTTSRSKFTQLIGMALYESYFRIIASKDRWKFLGPSLFLSSFSRKSVASLKMAKCVNERQFLDKLIKVSIYTYIYICILIEFRGVGLWNGGETTRVMTTK